MDLLGYNPIIKKDLFIVLFEENLLNRNSFSIITLLHFTHITEMLYIRRFFFLV